MNTKELLNKKAQLRRLNMTNERLLESLIKRKQKIIIDEQTFRINETKIELIAQEVVEGERVRALLRAYQPKK